MKNTNYKVQFFKSYNQTEQLQQTCLNISNICNEADGIKHTFFVDDQYDFDNGLKKLPWLYYASVNSEVIGFISTYVYDETKSEICAFVLPKYRRHKVFTRLYEQFCNDFGGQTFVACISNDNLIAKKWLNEKNFKYESTECMLKLSKKYYEPIPSETELVIIPNQDIIDFFYLYEAKRIGGCRAYFTSEDTIGISIVSIKDEYQGQGHGEKMMRAVLDELFSKCNSIILHVTKDNTPAYNLYTKLGFKPIETEVFYEKKD